jgi:hypothetical protein
MKGVPRQYRVRAKIIDDGTVAGHATRDASRRRNGRGDPVRVFDTSRPATRDACPAPPVGRPGAFEPALRQKVDQCEQFAIRLMSILSMSHLLYYHGRTARNSSVCTAPSTLAITPPCRFCAPVVKTTARETNHRRACEPWLDGSCVAAPAMTLTRPARLG